MGRAGGRARDGGALPRGHARVGEAVEHMHRRYAVEARRRLGMGTFGVAVAPLMVRAGVWREHVAMWASGRPHGQPCAATRRGGRMAMISRSMSATSGVSLRGEGGAGER